MRTERFRGILLSTLIATSLVVVLISVTSVTVKAPPDTIFSDYFDTAIDADARYSNWDGGQNGTTVNNASWRKLSSTTGAPKQGAGRLGLLPSSTTTDPFINTPSFATTGYNNIRISFVWNLELDATRYTRFDTYWSTDNTNWTLIPGASYYPGPPGGDNDNIVQKIISNVSVGSDADVGDKPTLYIKWRSAGRGGGSGSSKKVSFDNVVITGDPIACGVEVTIEPEHMRGTPGDYVYFFVAVHNTGNIVDNYILSVEPDGWPEEYFYLEDYRLENVEPCQTVTTFLEVLIPENALPCTHKEIVVVAESEFCGATDNDNALIQVVSKYLHNVDPGGLLEPDNWVCTWWLEIHPNYDYYYHLSSWEDTNMDGVVSPGDQIDMTDEYENITWYYVKDVTITLVAEDEWGYTYYLELGAGWENYSPDILEYPENTQWNMISEEVVPWLLSYWDDTDGDNYLDYCDNVYLELPLEYGYGMWVHVEGVATDLVLCELPPECGVEVTIEPKHNRGTPCTWLEFAVSVHNTGNVVDSYLLSVEPDGWPMENIYIEGSTGEVGPCETRTVFLYVHIPDNAEPCTHKEIVVWAESELCGATDNDNALIQVVSKYLHNVDPGGLLEPDNWVCTIWHEIYPTYCQYYHLSSWYDGNVDGWVSPGDQIDLMDENENIAWYYVKDVTITLVAEDQWGYTWYLELESGWENYSPGILSDPENTQWNMIMYGSSPYFCRWRLSYWEDDGDGYLDYCDNVYMEYKPLFEYGEWVHVVDVATDLVLCEMPPGCGVEVTIEPEHKRGPPGNEVFFYVSVHNTGTVQDNYILWIEPNGWPEEYFYLEDYRLENVEPCQTVTTYLEVFVPENALPCTHKEIVVWAESEFCDATDNDNALIQVVSKYLHNVEPGGLLEPGNWLGTEWHEIYPIYCPYYLLNSWEDTNMDGWVSPGDQIDLMDESENIIYYYVKDVTITLVVEDEYGYQWYLELEGGWENYLPGILYYPENTQWNMIRPYFCNQWRLSYWEDDGDGYLDYCDYVYIELKPFFDYWEWMHVVDVATDLVLCEIPEPWTGTATISMKNLYTVNVEKILDLNVGSKLVVKFYTYGDGYENENVVETFSPPAHVEENELARHPGPGRVGVKKARLDLTTDDTSNVISTIESFTVCKTMLEIRFTQIPLEWALAPTPEEKTELEIEFSEIPLYWALAPVC